MSEVREDPQSKDMAEETSGITSQDTADFNEGKTQSTNDLDQNLKQQHKVTADMASSFEPTNPDTKNAGDVCDVAVKNTDSTEKEVVLPPKGSSPDKDSTPKMEEKSNLSQADVENHGDRKQQSPENEEPAAIRKTNSDEGKMQSSNTIDDISCEENTVNDLAQKLRQQHKVTAVTASSSESANPDIYKDDYVDSVGAENTDSAEKELVIPQKRSSPDKDSTPKMEEKSKLRQADVENHSDTKQQSPENEEPAAIRETNSDKSHTREQEAPETTALPSLGDRKDDQVDGPRAKLNKEFPATNDKNAESGDDVKNVSASDEAQDTQEITALPQIVSEKQQLDERGNDVETIGPTTQEAPKPAVAEGSRRYLIAVGIVVSVAILVQFFLQTESPPQKNDVRQIDIFLRQLEKVKTEFPNQRAELWNRSRIHLKRHLQTAEPTEPVSLILTAGLRAERTLNCLAEGLASAFSSALNASVLHIDGASKASQDSDKVKLDIDRKLQGAFEGDKPVAIIHRFEELPPGSTLIFYRYCDHENAAYKKTFLIFTVLLGEEEEISAKISLSAVEEMVDDHLQKKFLSHGHPVSFDMMDLDKYGGLWSRISHLILPVAAEERIELEGCKRA